jgi:hypothetical protein
LEDLLDDDTEDVSHLYTSQQLARAHRLSQHKIEPQRVKTAYQGSRVVPGSGRPGSLGASAAALLQSRELRLRGKMFREAVDDAVDGVMAIERGRESLMHVDDVEAVLRRHTKSRGGGSRGGEESKGDPSGGRVTGTDLLKGNMTVARRKMQQSRARVPVAGGGATQGGQPWPPMLEHQGAGKGKSARPVTTEMDGPSQKDVILAAEERMKQRRRQEKEKQECELMIKEIRGAFHASQ